MGRGGGSGSVGSISGRWGLSGPVGAAGHDRLDRRCGRPPEQLHESGVFAAIVSSARGLTGNLWFRKY